MKKIKYSKNDFHYSFLPKNRKEVFFDSYKNRFFLIFRTGLLILACAIPLVVFSYLMDMIRITICDTYQNDEEMLLSVLSLHDFLLWVGICVSMFIVFLAVSGALRILRQLVWGEGIYFTDDLKIGIRQSYPMMALVTFILSIFLLGAIALLNFFSTSILTWTPILLFVLIVLPIGIWALLLVNTYQSKFLDYMRNAVFFYSKTLGFSILLSILTILPFGLSLFSFGSSIYFKFILIVVFILFYYPALLMIWILYSNKCFDQYLNQENYPEYYRKGLFDPEKDIRHKK